MPVRTLRRLGRTVIPLLAAWLFLSSCSLGASTQQSSGTLVMGLGTEPATLNPFEAADKSSVRALSPMFPNLYQLAPDLRVSVLKDRVGRIRPEGFAKYVEALQQAGLPE